MRKLTVIVMILSMAVLLGILIALEIASVVENTDSKQSVIDFFDTGGQHVPALLLVHMISSGYSLEFDDLCECEVKLYRKAGNSTPCIRTKFAHPGFFTSAIRPRRGSQVLHTSVFQVPENRNLREYLFVNCSHGNVTEMPTFYAGLLAGSVLDIIQFFAEADESVFQFYMESLGNHPFYIAPGGYKNLVLIDRRIVQTLSQKEVDYVNTIIDVHWSRAAMENSNFTEIGVSWETDIYSHAKEVEIETYSNVVLVVATAVLAGERLHAFWKRTSSAATQK